MSSGSFCPSVSGKRVARQPAWRLKLQFLFFKRVRVTHHCGNDPHDEHWCRQPEDFGEVKKQGGDPTNPRHQGTDAHRLVPHSRWEQLGRVEVDNEEGDGSTKLAHERQNELGKGYTQYVDSGFSLSSPAGSEVQDPGLLVAGHRRHMQGQKRPGCVTRGVCHLAEREGGTTTPAVNDEYAADRARNLDKHTGARNEIHIVKVAPQKEVCEGIA